MFFWLIMFLFFVEAPNIFLVNTKPRKCAHMSETKASMRVDPPPPHAPPPLPLLPPGGDGVLSAAHAHIHKHTPQPFFSRAVPFATASAER